MAPAIGVAECALLFYFKSLLVPTPKVLGYRGVTAPELFAPTSVAGYAGPSFCETS